jgi:hypothetical protein
MASFPGVLAVMNGAREEKIGVPRATSGATAGGLESD